MVISNFYDGEGQKHVVTLAKVAENDSSCPGGRVICNRECVNWGCQVQERDSVLLSLTGLSVFAKQLSCI